MKRIRTATSAFTLVETLVVIGIVIALVALGLPAYRKVLERMASIQCSRNLRTLAIAHQMYRQERGNVPPPRSVTASDPDSEGHNTWGLQILRHYYRSSANSIYTSRGQFIIDPTEKCPGAAITKQSLDLKQGGPDYNFVSLENYQSYTKSTSVNMDTYFGATAAYVPLIWDGWKPNWGAAPSIPLRHMNGANMAFMDCHIEWLRADDGRLYKGYIDSIYQTGQVDVSKEGTGTPLATTALQP